MTTMATVYRAVTSNASTINRESCLELFAQYALMKLDDMIDDPLNESIVKQLLDRVDRILERFPFAQ